MRLCPGRNRQTISLFAVAVAALAGSATAQVPMQQMPPDTQFASVIANEINAVAA